MFIIEQASLRDSELNKGDVTEWKRRVEEAFNDPKQNLNVEVSAYASPDGGFSITNGWLHSAKKNTSRYLEGEMSNKYRYRGRALHGSGLGRV